MLDDVDKPRASIGWLNAVVATLVGPATPGTTGVALAHDWKKHDRHHHHHHVPSVVMVPPRHVHFCAPPPVVVYAPPAAYVLAYPAYPAYGPPSGSLSLGVTLPLR